MNDQLALAPNGPPRLRLPAPPRGGVASYDDFSDPVQPVGAKPAASPYDAFADPVGVPAAPLTAQAHQDGRSVAVDYHDPEAVQRAYDLLQGNTKPSLTESAIRGYRQGALANFADESRGVAEASGMASWIPGSQIVGGARLAAEGLAPKVFGTAAHDRYRQTVDMERAADEAASRENPGTYQLGELAGVGAAAPVLPALAPFKAAEGAGAIVRGLKGAGNLATAGAAYGGLAGLGAGEGSIADRLPSAGQGALMGAAVTPLIGGALAGAGKVGGYMADQVAASRSPQRLADRAVSTALQRDAANPAAIAAEMDAAKAAGQDLTPADVAGSNTQALAGNVARMPGPAREPARQFLDERQVGGDATPSQGQRIGDQVGQLLGNGDEASYAASLAAQGRMTAEPFYQGAFKSQPGPMWDAELAQIADRPSMQKAIKDAGRIAAEEGKPLTTMAFDRAGKPIDQQAAETFLAGSRERLDSALGDYLGNGRRLATADEIMARRKVESAPAYDTARAQQIDYQSPNGQALLDTLNRVPNNARAAANDIIRIEDSGGHQMIWDPVPDAQGNFKLKAVPNIRQWDYIKRGLDTAIENSRDPVTGTVDTRGRAIQGLKGDMLDALDKAVPEFGKARAIYAGHSDLLDALRQGADHMRPGASIEEMQRAVAGMTPGEREMYRVGAANALRQKLANTGDNANLADAVFGNAAQRQKLRMLAPNADAAQRFEGAVQHERQTFNDATVPDMKGWHYALKSLDRQLLPHIDGETGAIASPEGQAIRATRDQLRAILARNPAYQAGTRAEGSIADTVTAMKRGSQAWLPSKRPEDIARDISMLDPQALGAYRLTAANALNQKLGNVADGVDKARLAYGNPAVREKIAALAPDQPGRAQFADFLRREKQMFGTRARLLGGSPTAERLGDMQDFAGNMVEGATVAAHAAQGRIGLVLKAAARHLAKVNPELRGKVLDEVRQIVLNVNRHRNGTPDRHSKGTPCPATSHGVAGGRDHPG